MHQWTHTQSETTGRSTLPPQTHPAHGRATAGRTRLAVQRLPQLLSLPTGIFHDLLWRHGGLPRALRRAVTAGDARTGSRGPAAPSWLSRSRRWPQCGGPFPKHRAGRQELDCATTEPNNAPGRAGFRQQQNSYIIHHGSQASLQGGKERNGMP